MHDSTWGITRLVKLWLRGRRARATLPDWRRLREPQAAAETLPTCERVRVLLVTNVGSFLPGTILESLLGAALSARGAECHVLLCDSALPACLACEHRFYGGAERLSNLGPQADLCKSCFLPAAQCYEGLPVTLHRFSELLVDSERTEAARTALEIAVEEIPRFSIDGLAVGEHAVAGALRFFARGDLDGEPFAEAIVRRYLEAALLTVFATRRLLNDGFDVAVFHHGIYVPQGLVGEVARSRGVRVVNWNAAYRKQCFIFSHEDTYHHTLMDEPPAVWESLPWSDAQEHRILEYLRSRWDGRHDWITFQNAPRLETEEIEKETGLDFTKPCVALLTNVVWDAQLHYPANAFSNMMDWVIGTIEYFRARPEVQLVIRVHPAEVRGSVPSRQRVTDEIARVVGDLPANVFVIPPTSRISTYVVAEQSDSVIIYGTKMGVELSSLGIPIIVAGEAWIRGKGVTLDAHSREEYFSILDRVPLGSRMDPAAVRRARMYAYHFFFRRMIPVRSVRHRRGWPPFDVGIRTLDRLRSGVDPGLDVICDGILKGEPFVYPAEFLDGRGENVASSVA